MDSEGTLRSGCERGTLPVGVLDAVPDVFYVFDTDGSVVRYNDRVLEVTGYSPETVETMNPWEFFPEDEREQIQTSVEQVITAGQQVRTEGQFLTADGTTIPYEFSAAPLYDDTETVVGFAGIGRDVSEREATERDLRLTNRGIEAAPIGVVISDPTQADNPLIYVNSRFEEMTGYAPAEAIGRNCRFLQGEQTSPEAVETLRAAIADGEPVTVELRNYRKDGTEFWSRVSIAPIEDASGEVTNFVGFQEDITRRKTQQSELEQQREFLRQIQAVADIGGWEVDFQTGSNRWTTEVYRIHGLDPEDDVTVEDGIEFYHPDDRDTIVTALERLQREDEPYDLELRIVRSNGEVRWVRTRGEPLIEDGQVVGARGTFQDITDTKEREQKLTRQRDNLEVLDQMVRHDIRNNLQVTAAHAEQLRDAVDEDHQESLEQILTNVEAAVEITQSARDLATVMLQTESSREPIDLSYVLARELEAVRETTDTASITVDGELPAVRVWGDDMLSSVFRNLLTNAIQHNETDDPEVVVSAADHGELVQVRIADNGPGIPVEYRDEIFGKGKKGLESGGTGIGLYLVTQVVERYGGDVRIEDNDPEGTVFVVELPTEP